MPNRVLIVETKPVHAAVLANMLAARYSIVFQATNIDAALRICAAQSLSLALVHIESEQSEVFTRLGDLHKAIRPAALAAMSGDPRVLASDALRLHSEFLVRMPVLGRDLDEIVLDASLSAHGTTPRPHVLVVENTFEGREAIAEQIRDTPFRASFEPTVEKAVQRLAWDRVDAVLIDVFVPGMGGIEGITLLRHMWPQIPICAVSADIEGEMPAAMALRAAARIGATATLARPFGVQELEAALTACLGRRQGAALSA